MEWMEWMLVKAQPEEWREIWEAPQGTGGDGDGRADAKHWQHPLRCFEPGPHWASNPSWQGARGSRWGPGLDLPDLNRYTHSHCGFWDRLHLWAQGSTTSSSTENPSGEWGTAGRRETLLRVCWCRELCWALIISFGVSGFLWDMQ